ncbi:MAG: CBS domain-containing protein [Bryobacteraceae bacterium]
MLSKEAGVADMTSKDVMTADPIACLPEDTVLQAADLMKQTNVGFMPVVSDRTARRLVGVLTDRDLVLRVDAQHIVPAKTMVRDVMTPEPVTCSPEARFSDVLSIMAEHQLRRLPVVDCEGKLLGVVSHADLALYMDEMAQAAGIHAPPSKAKPAWNCWALAADFVVAAGVGAGLMYLLDPNRGRARRNRIAEQASSLYHRNAEAVGKFAEDIGNRARGTVAEMRGAFACAADVPDQKLAARVKTRLGRVSTHPHALEVEAHGGVVTLHGDILMGELDKVLRVARRVPGVKQVDNRLAMHVTAEGVPRLGGGARAAAS